MYLGVEKDALAGLLLSWFRDLGIGIVAVRGYSSESLIEDLRDEAADDGRPAVMLYAGDFDPPGEDIPRDLGERLDGDVMVERIALTHEQVLGYDLPPALGKASDSRAAAFEERHWELIQVELDALPPDALRGLYEDALDRFWGAFEVGIGLID